jgi:hypothetical protein
VAAALLTLALAAACTSEAAPPGPTSGGEGSPQTSPPPVTSADSYVYTDAAGIEGEVRLDASSTAATLTIRNDTGDVLPKPGVYVLDARDGSRSDWRVVAAKPVPDGGSAEFAIERTPVPEAKHIGLVVLLLGGEDYGAFVPPRNGAA